MDGRKRLVEINKATLSKKKPQETPQIACH
uniref:Uncharacterized protein n=1 Tax=Anguilla anguilla TaxID=7936 RepID=A0A0E9PGQ9_ANGAN